MKSIFTSFSTLIITIIIFNSCDKKNATNTNTNQTTNTPKTVNSILQSLNGKISGEYLGRSFEVYYDTISGAKIDTIDFYTNNWTLLTDSSNSSIQLNAISSNYSGECNSTDSVLMSGLQISSPVPLPYPKYISFIGVVKASKSINNLPQTNLDNTIFKFCTKTYSSYPGCSCDLFDQNSFYNSLSSGTMDPTYSAENYEIQYNTNNDSIYIYTSKSFNGYTTTNKLKIKVQHNYIYRGKYIR